MKIILAADHAGFTMKEVIKKYLEEKEYEVLDCGTTSGDLSVDYPDFGFKAAEIVASNKADMGVLICGTGIGMSMVANKVQGIRATLCHDHYTAEMSRKHNNSNILVMGSRVTSIEIAKDIVDTWLTTEFEAKKHKIRIDKIANYENVHISKTFVEPFTCGKTGGRTFVINHPLIKHKLGIMRNKNTSSKDFRDLVHEVSALMIYPATCHLALEEIEIETPIEKTKISNLSGKKLAVVSVLRAGLGMAEGILKVIPNAKEGHIGLYRDHKTLKPVDYYCKLPNDISERDVFVVDPMLATGGSVASAVRHIKAKGAKKISLISLLAVPEGIARFHEEHPDVDLYVAAIDSHLDKNAYIVPGLGDAGDRLFGTK
ncbi:MAG: uracil phosphoribosyltransferase [Synergistaceae bacterium]|nr:uracil phosphoribosyltransferase [Synergistaceae bacterium]